MRPGCCASAARPCRRPCRSGKGAMAALLGVGKEVGEKLAAEAAQGEVCQLANDNEPTQAVISGAKTAIDRAGQLAKAHGVRRFMPLNVSAPFHCALMQPAADAMAEALAKVDYQSAGRSGGRQCAGGADLRSGRDQAAPGRAGDRHRALARMRDGHGRGRRHRHLRDRLRQGARRARQAHRADAQCNLHRHAAGYRRGAAVALTDRGIRCSS